MPEVPRHQAGTTALGLRGVSKKLVGIRFADRSLRILRRSSRARRLLTRRHELACGDETDDGFASFGTSSAFHVAVAGDLRLFLFTSPDWVNLDRAAASLFKLPYESPFQKFLRITMVAP